MNAGNIQIAFISVLCIHMFAISSTVVTLRMSLCNCQNSKKPVVNGRDPLWFYLSLCIKDSVLKDVLGGPEDRGTEYMRIYTYIHTCIPRVYVYNVYTSIHPSIHPSIHINKRGCRKRCGVRT